MATIKAVNSRASIGKAINYVTKEEKTEEKLITGKDCDPFHAIDDMKATKELWGKTGGRQYKHYVQSFHKDEDITPEKAHKIACELAEKDFKGYECLISTHTDRGHIHSHIIVNSVNFETGEKFRQSTKWLEHFKSHSDDLCRKYDLTVTEKGKTFEGAVREDMTAWSKDKYNLLQKAEQGKVKSYVLDTAFAVMDCKETATSKEDFIQKMAERGYRTDWESRKTITFENQEGQKVRNSNLENTFHIPFGKEQLEYEFEANARAEKERTAEPEFSAEDRELYNTLHAIADRQSRAEQAYNAVSERFADGADNDSTSFLRPRTEERSPVSERNGASPLTPSETVRSITDRVQRYSIEARNALRGNLQSLIAERRQCYEKCLEAKRNLAELKQERTRTDTRIDTHCEQQSRTTAELRELNERAVGHQSQGLER